jgi:BirA family transcriptional regulator, biotin operon repressor / biotin---[acetyl-CoA-carboxylase] ligase
MNKAIPLDAGRIRDHLPDGIPFGPILIRKSLPSTNTSLLEGARRGEYAPGTVIAAEEQTAGRGRMDRTWITPPGQALAFSLLIANPVPAEPGLLSVGAALAVAEAIEERTGLTPTVKWPNDVCLNRRKTAGILAEAFQKEGEHFAVVGIGINANAAPAVPGRHEGMRATSLAAEGGGTTDRSLLLAAFLARFHEILLPLRSRDGSGIVEGLRRRSLLVGCEARFSRSNRVYSGRVAGHSEDLGIILDTAEGRITLPGAGTDLLDFRMRP